MKGKALRRALETSDVGRIGTDLPNIVDTTELISPDTAYEMLLVNTNNRPVNWRKVEDYAAIMAAGKWELHAQGIILDNKGNLLTGQKRLWAIIYSNTSVYMRVSRGNPARVATLLDRGDPQTSRDLASRQTGRKHSPSESSIARGIQAMHGILRPSADVLADTIRDHAETVSTLFRLTTGVKKTKAVLMIIAATCASKPDEAQLHTVAERIQHLADRLEERLKPESAESCWGKGSAFTLAMNQAKQLVEGK